nr:transposase [Paenisporosarcina sp. TG-14]
MENSFIYPYNNGRIEGINNIIKVLNRVALFLFALFISWF